MLERMTKVRRILMQSKHTWRDECKPANMFLLFIFFLIFLQTISNHSTARSREKSIADADASLSLARETHAKKKNTVPKQDLQAPSNSDGIVTRLRPR